jgi:membrane-associated phospholipid phosphatase
MEEREDRIKPFLLITLLYIVFTGMLHMKRGLSVGDNLFNFLLIIDVLVVFSLLITFFYKASIHSVGIWGIIGILLPLNKVIEDYTIFIATLIALVLAGLVMSARLQLNAHTPREVLVGAVAGFSIGFFGMLILF